MAILVMALVRIGADATELIWIGVDGGVAAASTDVSLVGRVGVAGVAGASTTGLGETGSIVFRG
jgi:hypothetical protein